MQPWKRTENHTDPRAYIALAAVFAVLLFATLDRVAATVNGAVFTDGRLPLGKRSQSRYAPTPAPKLSAGAVNFVRFMEHNTTPDGDVLPAQKGNKPPTPQLKALAKATGWEFFYPVWGRFDAQGNRLETPSAEKLSDLEISLEELVDDPDRRLEKDFRTPPWLRSRVLFWLGVHAAYSTKMRVIHDRRDPSIIYGFLDFRAIYAMTDRRALGDSWAYRLEAKVKKLIRNRLMEAGGLAKPGFSGMTAQEREAVQSFVSRNGWASKELVSKALPNIRSQTGQRDEVMAAMRRSRDLLPHIEATLKRYDMPTALGRIPFVESSFNARAYSKVGAVGIWQFMPATAKQFISKDHRLWTDPLRQTVAAARMLRIFRAQLPDWSTTVTAYNSGAGRLSRLVRKFRTDSLEGILSAKGSNGLGFAGENFYATFLSANLVEAYRHQVFHKYLESSELAAVTGRRRRLRLPMDALRCDY